MPGYAASAYDEKHVLTSNQFVGKAVVHHKLATPVLECSEINVRGVELRQDDLVGPLDIFKCDSASIEGVGGIVDEVLVPDRRIRERGNPEEAICSRFGARLESRPDDCRDQGMTLSGR